jgi:menaquinone-specific isochorismate synthase
MKFQATRVSDDVTNQAIELATQSGWLVRDGGVLRCGFGDAIVTRVCHSLEELVEVSNIFDGLGGDGCNLLSAFASVPFNRSSEFHVVVPRFQVTSDGDGISWLLSPEGETWNGLGAETHGAAFPKQVSFLYSPTPDSYAAAVAEAIGRLRAGSLQKVVLARSCRGELSGSINTAAIATRLHHLEPTCTIYAMPTIDGRRFTGASPELLVSKFASKVRCHPLAGTVSTKGMADTSAYTNWLRGSPKNLVEHRIVVEEIVSHLYELCETVVATKEPSIVSLRSVAHLGTEISGIASDGITILDLVATLHPTPAVAGLPREAAEKLINELEPSQRGSYAGAVGYFNSIGDGAWWVAIRGILTKGSQFEVWAGAGIVADSDPIAEREETKYKMDSVLHAIGLGTIN